MKQDTILTHMKLIRLAFLSWLIVVVVFQSCTSDPYPAPPASLNPVDTSGNGGTQPQTKPCHPDTLYFQRDILPIFASNCAFSGCHGSNNPQKGVDLSTYQTIINTGDIRPNDPDGSDVFEVITETDASKRMPPPPTSSLSTADIEKIRKWINQGALNLTCDDCDTATVTFSGSIKPIINNNCISCHNPSSLNGGLDLSTHGEVVNATNNRNLLERINHQGTLPPMPPNGNKLSSCNLRMFEIWKQAGLPNN